MVDAPAARVILPGSTVGETNMGTFDVAFSIRSADADRTLQLVGLVDTGALYSVVPGSVLDDLGIARDEEEQFVLADGSIVQMPIGSARFEIDGRARGLAGKPLAGFCTTPSRRITVVYGVIVYAIRFKTPSLHR